MSAYLFAVALGLAWSPRVIANAHITVTSHAWEWQMDIKRSNFLSELIPCTLRTSSDRSSKYIHRPLYRKWKIKSSQLGHCKDSVSFVFLFILNFLFFIASKSQPRRRRYRQLPGFPDSTKFSPSGKWDLAPHETLYFRQFKDSFQIQLRRAASSGIMWNPRDMWKGQQKTESPRQILGRWPRIVTS